VSQASLPLPSRVLGRYAMYEQFAAGGMATLHYGRLLGPSGFSRTVAIKRLHAHLSEDPDFVTMFLDEARLAARIHHPNVIQTLDVESSEGELFVVLDYVHGDSLSRLLREARRLGESVTPGLVGTMLFGALEGLHAAHEARDAAGDPLELVHRDISPHNILVGTDGIARVLDFGVAKARGRAQTTRVGQLKGKLAYMAPEQLRGNVSRRTDVFAASVVLWEALTGTRLFQGDDEGEVVDKLLHQTIPSPRQYAPLVTPELEEVVMRGLERDPSRRFATAREMAIALESKVALATPIEVGAFVERIGGGTLAQRAERVAAIEAECGAALETGADRNTPAEIGALRPAAKSLTGATSPTVAVPGLALPDDRTILDRTVESLGTGVATVSEMHVPGRRRRAGVIGAASLIGVAAVFGVALMARSGARHAPETPASAGQPAPSAAEPAQPPPSPASSAASEPSSPYAESLGAHPAPADEPRRKPAASPARSRAGCSPPYTIDARGLRHYKPECL
jgi:eukaryotic-like serine/threonine-protein kinase